jgi:DNA-binding CsgD family transcriptional regulator
MPYVEGVQNREIMARLYISEGTFNRTRRNAIRGLARLLVEKIKM